MDALLCPACVLLGGVSWGGGERGIKFTRKPGFIALDGDKTTLKRILYGVFKSFRVSFILNRGLVEISRLLLIYRTSKVGKPHGSANVS